MQGSTLKLETKALSSARIFFVILACVKKGALFENFYSPSKITKSRPSSCQFLFERGSVKGSETATNTCRTTHCNNELLKKQHRDPRKEDIPDHALRIRLHATNKRLVTSPASLSHTDQASIRRQFASCTLLLRQLWRAPSF